MLGPDSRLLTALLVIASAAFLVAAIRFRLLPVKALCGALSIVVAMTGGIAAVNYYYGYYTSWGQLWADFHGGNTGNLGVISAAATTTQLESGRFGWVSLPGKLGAYAWAVLGPTLAYAASLVGEAADDVRAIDTAMKLGYNWSYGPFELIDRLGSEQSATATRCAEVLGESVASCSYHLGILAKYGYIELVPDQPGGTSTVASASAHSAGPRRRVPGLRSPRSMIFSAAMVSPANISERRQS